MDGFGTLFEDAKKVFDRPVFLTEFGCDAYAQSVGVDEESQMKYDAGNWRDIVLNKAGGPKVGNAIGGSVFEFIDEWWKAPGDPEDQQSTQSQHAMPFPDGYGHEEWFGVTGHAEGSKDSLSRHLRKAYFYFKDNFDKIPE